MKKIFNLFDYKLKIKILYLIFFMVLASFLELMGLGLVILILNYFLGLDDNFTKIINDYAQYYYKINIDSEQIIFFIFILFTFKLLVMILVSWMESGFYAKFRENISNRLYHNFLNRNAKNLLRKNSAEYIRNFTEEIQVSLLFITSSLKLILDSILIITFLIFLIYFDPIITLAVYIFFSSLGIIYYKLVKNKLSNWAIISLENRRKKIQFITESFSAIKSIKILSRETFFLDKFKKQIESISRIQFKINFLGELPRNILEYILFISILALFLFLIQNNYSNENIIQLLSIYTLAAFRLVPIMNRLLGHMQKIKYSYPSINKLIIENEQKIDPKSSVAKKIKLKKNIILIIKKFSFNGRKDFLLKNVSIEIKKYNKIGIIGDSGSGKSTIIDILCGFQNNEFSKLIVDGTDIFRSRYLNNWQNSLGYVPQNIIILNQSLRDNILFGADKKNFNDEILKDLLKKVELERFVKKSKDGLSQILRQDGENISGGEKQRIGIARALINDPDLLILDEATSGLDYETENNILKTINKLRKTTIIVSHRLNALKDCEKIYLLKNKKLNLLKKTTKRAI